ncbi:hypothetical protein ACVJMZ_000287 [Sinorhizobium medicae]
MRDDFVVEVIGRMMQARRVAISDEHEGARPGKQHVGEVLAAHQRIERFIDVAFAGNRGGDGKRVAGFGGVVHGHRIVTAVPDVDRGAIGESDALGDLADPDFADVPHLRRQSAHCAGESGLFGG